MTDQQEQMQAAYAAAKEGGADPAAALGQSQPVGGLAGLMWTLLMVPQAWERCWSQVAQALQSFTIL